MRKYLLRIVQHRHHTLVQASSKSIPNTSNASPFYKGRAAFSNLPGAGGFTFLVNRENPTRDQSYGSVAHLTCQLF